MTFLKYFRKCIESIKDKILYFAPFSMIGFLTLFILIFYNIEPFRNGFFTNHISAYFIYYIALGSFVSLLQYLKKKVFAGTFYVIVLVGQIKMFIEQWQQYNTHHPTMGPIFTLYSFIAFGFLLGLCFEGGSSIRKNIINVKNLK